MSFLKVVGKKLRSVVSRDPRLINAYGILRINALATPEMVREHYLKITKDRLESNWLRDAQFSYKVLSDPELRERHDEALKKRLGIEDLFFLERKQQGLELFGFVSKDPKSEDSNKGYHRVKCITDKPLIRSTMHTESDVFFTEEVEQRFERC